MIGLLQLIKLYIWKIFRMDMACVLGDLSALHTKTDFGFIDEGV